MVYVFAQFFLFPLASASLVQVHAATTHDGKQIAVKVVVIQEKTAVHFEFTYIKFELLNYDIRVEI